MERLRSAQPDSSPGARDLYFFSHPCPASPMTTFNIASSLAEYGPEATIAVIPKGPYVLPTLMG